MTDYGVMNILMVLSILLMHNEIVINQFELYVSLDSSFIFIE